LNLPEILRRVFFGTIVGLLAGAASAAFLISLDHVTAYRESHLWLIWLLPLAGFAVGWLYHRHGADCERGHDLILEEIREPKKHIPFRMAPLVLIGTLITHLFGGSAGREGTAVQMSASLGDQLTRIFKFTPEQRTILLMSALAAGFSSVFGTPLAGTFFGLEVLAVGRMRYGAILPCLVAAIVGHETTLALGATHTEFSLGEVAPITLSGAFFSFLAGAAFGVLGMLFVDVTHWISGRFKDHVAYPPLRPLIGGAAVAALVLSFDLWRYIGLGIPAIVESLEGPVPAHDFLFKFALTALTLGAGFKGGEVTPLFFIGSTFGNALSRLLPLPGALLSGMGFVAVFAGVANVPFTSILMSVELFGVQSGPYVAIACVGSYFFSGHTGIYRSQRIGSDKYSAFKFPKGGRLSKLLGRWRN
jgi:H+/Cl- antiporter ClcA